MPRLTLVETGSSKNHRVEGTEILVGRDPACRIALEGEEAKTVSARHARFFIDGDRWFVEDAGSRNGTFVGTTRLEAGVRHAIVVGDVVGLGLTGTQLEVKEAVGRVLAATLVERSPGVAAAARSAHAGHSNAGGGEAVRLVLHGSSGRPLVGHADQVTIGRALECLIRVEGDAANSVSRVHAVVSVVDGEVMLRDGGSRHGTYVNRRKIDAPTRIAIGDAIMLGPGGPVFTVEEASIGTAVARSGSQVDAQRPREREVGPTDGRAASKRSSPEPVNGARGTRAALQSTPGLGEPAFRASPRERATEPIPRRSPATFLSIAAILLVIAAVFFLVR